MKLYYKHLPEIEKNVGLVAAGTVLRETQRKGLPEHGRQFFGGPIVRHLFLYGTQIQKKAQKTTYVDLFTDNTHFRTSLESALYPEVERILRGISKDMPDVYLSMGVREIIEGKQEFIPFFPEDRYYERYLKWLIQLRYTRQGYSRLLEVATAVREELPRLETEAPLTATSKQEEDAPKLLERVEVTEGKILGNHKILEELGEGGMGIVYKAEQISLGRTVAMKVLPQHFTRDSSFVERFLNEAHAIAALNHPNIVQIYDVGQEGETYY
ncbi:MAG: protein kinase, partial [Candidatus Hydrogenedentota bacterium]